MLVQKSILRFLVSSFSHPFVCVGVGVGVGVGVCILLLQVSEDPKREKENEPEKKIMRTRQPSTATYVGWNDVEVVICGWSCKREYNIRSICLAAVRSCGHKFKKKLLGLRVLV